MGHMPMTGPGGTLEEFAPIAARRRIFVHINNTNPALLADSPERAHLAAAGWEVGEDGMELVL
jgi:pyrroloquinoline quinone biosynthesis protein B